MPEHTLESLGSSIDIFFPRWLGEVTVRLTLAFQNVQILFIISQNHCNNSKFSRQGSREHEVGRSVKRHKIVASCTSNRRPCWEDQLALRVVSLYSMLQSAQPPLTPLSLSLADLLSFSICWRLLASQDTCCHVGKHGITYVLTPAAYSVSPWSLGHILLQNFFL